jgi:hypothetical protein
MSGAHHSASVMAWYRRCDDANLFMLALGVFVRGRSDAEDCEGVEGEEGGGVVEVRLRHNKQVDRHYTTNSVDRHYAIVAVT